MACNKWEETGLLYCSYELSEQDAKKYEAHLTECPECNAVYAQYTGDKKSFFTCDILGEYPSKLVDEEIIRVCTAKKQYTSVGFFSGVVRKTVYSVSFFILGFAVVGYFMMNVEDAKNQKSQYTLQPSSIPASQVLAQQDSNAAVKDSVKDSAVYFSRNRGNLQANGVYPVDLK